MKIYTKGGDKGTTFSPGIGRVVKYHCSVDAQGELDELNSWLAVASGSLPSRNRFVENLLDYQRDLMEIGAQLATGTIRLNKHKIKKMEECI